MPDVCLSPKNMTKYIRKAAMGGAVIRMNPIGGSLPSSSARWVDGCLSRRDRHRHQHPTWISRYMRNELGNRHCTAFSPLVILMAIPSPASESFRGQALSYDPSQVTRLHRYSSRSPRVVAPRLGISGTRERKSWAASLAAVAVASCRVFFDLERILLRVNCIASRS